MLTIHAASGDGHTTLTLSGELTIFTMAQAHQECLAHWEHQPGLSLDLAQVDELDAAGVQFLAWLKREAADRGQSVTFLNHSPAVVEGLDLLKITSAFGDPILLPPARS